MQITLRPFGTQAARVPSPQKQASLLHSLHMLCAPTLATCQFPPPAALKSPNQSTPVFILHCHGLASQRLVCMLHCLGLTSQWPVCMLRPHGHATWCACCTASGSHHSGQCACCAPMGTQHGVHAALSRAHITVASVHVAPPWARNMVCMLHCLGLASARQLPLAQGAGLHVHSIFVW